MEWYPWLVFLHVLGGFAFVLAHGASAMTAFQLRREREPSRIAALLDLSSYSIGFMYISLLVLLASGIAAGFVGGFWGRLWIWIALGLLIGVMAVMYAIAMPYYGRLRKAVGPEALGDAAQLVRSPRPFLLAAVGGIGLTAILWLMYFKPF
jgi:hypothetical protein